MKAISARFLLLLMGCLLLPVADCHAARVTLLVNNWTSQIVLTHVTGQLLKELGYQPVYLQSDVSEQWGALSHGVADVQVEVWEGTMADALERLVASGLVLDAGAHTAKTREDWWYPEYVEALCPGLPDWKALNRCSRLFSVDGSDDIGVYIAGPWEKPDEARIRALEMNFKVSVVEKGDDLWVLLKEAEATKRPIVLFNWTPNWVESVYPGRFIEFPQYHQECETNPQWGVNPNRTYDCGNPVNGWLKKLVSKKLSMKHPCAYQLIQRIDFSNQQIAAASAYVDVAGLSYEGAASKWLQANVEVWRGWIPNSCQK